MAQSMSQDEFRNTRASKLQDEDCCHLCGVVFQAGDQWQYVDAIEHYNEDEKSVCQPFRTKWHLDCHYFHVKVKGAH